MKTFFERLALGAFEGLVNEAGRVLDEAKKEVGKIVKQDTQEALKVEVEVIPTCKTCDHADHKNDIGGKCQTCLDEFNFKGFGRICSMYNPK